MCDSIGAYSGSTCDALTEVRVYGRARDRFQPLKLPRGGHVEPLDDVVHHPNGQDNGKEDRRGETDHEQGSQYLRNGNGDYDMTFL